MSSLSSNDFNYPGDDQDYLQFQHFDSNQDHNSNQLVLFNSLDDFCPLEALSADSYGLILHNVDESIPETKEEDASVAASHPYGERSCPFATERLAAECDPLLFLSMDAAPVTNTVIALPEPQAVSDSEPDWSALEDLVSTQRQPHSATALSYEATVTGEPLLLMSDFEAIAVSKAEQRVGVPFVPEEKLCDFEAETIEQAVLVALGYLGRASVREIWDLIRDRKLKPTLLQCRTPVCSISNSITTQRKRNQPAIECDDSGSTEKQNVYRLTAYGADMTARLLHIPTDEIDPSAMSLPVAFSDILRRGVVMTRKEIHERFYRLRYARHIKMWSTDSQGADVLDASKFFGSLGLWMKKAIKANTLGCFRTFYWLFESDWDETLFARLEQENPYSDLGAVIFRERVLQRIHERMEHSDTAYTRESKIFDSLQPITENYDRRCDALNLLIPHEAESNFFVTRQSSVPGAGLGLFARHQLPPYTALLVKGKRSQEAYNSGDFHPYSFSYDDDAGRPWVIYAGDEQGASCAASTMNDSRVGQQFSCHSIATRDGETLVYLMSECTIEAGQECFFDYGTDYWYASGITPAQAPASAFIKLQSSVSSSHPKRATSASSTSSSKRQRSSNSDASPWTSPVASPDALSLLSFSSPPSGGKGDAVPSLFAFTLPEPLTDLDIF